MSKILIVGNGPSALEKEYGSIIDSDKWDVVMRFNRWNKDDDGTEWAQGEDETWYYRESGQSDWSEWQG